MQLGTLKSNCCSSNGAVRRVLPLTRPLTPHTRRQVAARPALMRRLADAHYLDVYEDDFQWRGDLWKTVHADENAFWRGEIINLPEDDWHERGGNQYSYFALLMEEPVLEDVFLYAIFRARKTKLQRLQRHYQLGDSREHELIADSLLRSKEISLADADRSRLMRKLMDVEIKALEDLTSGDEVTFDGIVSREAAAEPPMQFVPVRKAGELMSQLVEKYLDDTGRQREWPTKTVLRKRGELREFLEIIGDKPINAYTQVDGLSFKDVQLALPIYRQKSPYKGLTLVEAAKKASELRAIGAVSADQQSARRWLLFARSADVDPQPTQCMIWRRRTNHDQSTGIHPTPGLQWAAPHTLRL